MTQFTERQLLDAQSCQLLIGSFDGSTFGCHCKSPSQCVFTEGERACLHDRPNVSASRKRRQQEFRETGAE